MDSLNIKSSAIVYRQKDNKYEYLCLKREKSDGTQAGKPEGWWEFPSGGVHDGESLKDAMLRELQEETGITSYINVIDNFCDFSWEWENQIHKTYVFAVEVFSDININLEPTEHEDYLWCTYEQTLDLLTYDKPKESLKEFNHRFVKTEELKSHPS